MKKQIERHSAGAIVIHKSPFDHIKTPYKSGELDKEFINKWVIPFYLGRLSENFEGQFLQLKDELNADIVKQLLGDFNWRTRITGAYFAALMNYKEFDDFIGINLIKSEVCYAAEGYLIALSNFNNQKTIDYIKQYLDYYLTQKQLWFDQGDAMAALIWLDKMNGTNLINENHYRDKWNLFVDDKPDWNLENYIESFEERMRKIERIKSKI